MSAAASQLASTLAPTRAGVALRHRPAARHAGRQNPRPGVVPYRLTHLAKRGHCPNLWRQQHAVSLVQVAGQAPNVDRRSRVHQDDIPWLAPRSPSSISRMIRALTLRHLLRSDPQVPAGAMPNVPGGQGGACGSLLQFSNEGLPGRGDLIQTAPRGPP